jgi:peptidoglycan/xylan/chitin deacetylase (PgdA/CDA1 family)
LERAGLISLSRQMLKMNLRRIQLTLFIDEDYSAEIETIRKKFNPLQYVLIPSHVTLCRENDLEQIERVIQNLERHSYARVSIEFGNPIRFSEGKGILIPANGNNEQFYNLRTRVLENIIINPRNHDPHITLMHPRNSTCTDDIFNQVERMSLPKKIEFTKVSLIEQEGQLKWNILREFQLGRDANK